MFDQWNRSASKSRLSAVSGLVFHHTAVVLLLTLYCGGQAAMVGPTKPILAMLGDVIMLPCHLEPPADVVSETLEWSRADLDPRFVHVRRDGVELLVNQNPSYIGRTSLSTNKLKCGDMSMTLSKVRLTDEGTYRCHIPQLGTSQVELVVGALSFPVVIIAEIDKPTSRAVLQCESKGWYPEPEVSWLDSEGHVLSAGPTETVRGPDGLYTVSSRVTVEKRHSNYFTCRVQQKNINQTRETQIRIREDVFMARDRGSDVRISVVLTVVCLLLSAAGFFIFWKLRQKKSKNKMNHDKETEDRTGETEQLVQGSTTVKDLEDLDEKLKEKEEEKTDMIDVISVLTEQKKELENYRDKLISQVQEVEREKRENEKKLKSVNKGYSWDKDDRKSQLIELKDELENDKENYKKSLQKTVEKLQKTDDMITRLTERKKKVEEQIEQMKNHLEEIKRQKDEIQLQSEQLEREETNKNTESSKFNENHYPPTNEGSSHQSHIT